MLKQPAVRRKKKISSLIYAIVSVGFLTQVGNLLSLYLDYAVTYTTKYHIPASFTVPAIYICKPYPLEYDLSMDSRIEDAPGPKDLIKSCKVFIKNDTFVACDRVTSYSLSYDNAYICIGLFETNQMKMDVDILTHFSDELHLDPLFEIVINTDDEEPMNYKVIVGPNDGQLLVTENSDSIESCLTRIVSEMMVTFSRTYFSYLPAPYASECIDYQAEHLLNRAHLVNRCMIKNSLIFPANVLTDKRNWLWNLKFVGNEIDEKWLQAMKKCEAKYPMIECNQHDFTIATKSLVRNYNETSSSVAFRLHHHSGHDIIIDEQPEMSLFYLSINTGGVLSLWLGLSAYDLVAKLTDTLYDKYEERRFNKRLFINLGKQSYIFKPQKITLPSVTICMWRTINWTRAPSYYKHLSKQGIKPEQFMLLRDFFAFSPQPDEVFSLNDTQLRRPEDMRAVRYLSRYRISESIGQYLKCFTLFSYEQTRKRRKPEIYLAETLRLIYWAKITMVTDFAQKLFIVYHQGSNFKSYFQDPSVIFLTQEKVNHFRLSYDSTVVKFMANHRKSTCVDYMKLTSINRADNIRKCCIWKYKEKYPGYFPIDEYSYKKLAIAYNAKFGVPLDEQSRHECTHMFRKRDCVNEYFATKLQDFRFNHDHENFTQFELNLPYGAAIHFDQEMNIQFVELMCYLGSLVGFYLGLSVYAILYSPASVSGEHLYHFTYFLADYWKNIDFHHSNN
ncbi:hypothetical protein HDE_13073 [Halotydeus destructor]|nr:hypothetical protein HDE_13073 [Halotydeus destructor]